MASINAVPVSSASCPGFAVNRLFVDGRIHVSEVEAHALYRY